MGTVMVISGSTLWGYAGRKKSIEIGRAAFELQYLVASELVHADVDFILETAFHSASAFHLRSLLATSEIFQAWVFARLAA